MNRFLPVYLLMLSWAAAASPVAILRNDRVIAYQETIPPAATESSGDGFPNATVFLNDAGVTLTPDGGKPVDFRSSAEM